MSMAPEPRSPVPESRCEERAAMSDTTPKSSDQMPEEAPAEQVPDDVPEAQEGAARESGGAHAREAETDTSPLGHRGTGEQRAYERADDEEG
jgi:hypothetical protein